MPVPHIEITPDQHPVTLPFLGSGAGVLWSWEVRHSAETWSSGVADSPPAAYAAVEEAIGARGGAGIVQNCALGIQRSSTDRSQYDYGPAISRAVLEDGRVVWTI